jgi:hypothetical protein
VNAAADPALVYFSIKKIDDHIIHSFIQSHAVELSNS